MKMPFFKKNGKQRSGPGLLKRFLRRFGRNPYADWTAMLVISAALAVTLALLSLAKFINFEAELAKKSAAPKGEASQTMNVQVLDKVLGDFDAAAARHANLLRGYDGPGDPSL